ncbi:hypothetical protein [Flammeovirga sp. SJP92]|uniref:hypothetical protein n=1 Tax=Flammeovirga sp. SJP92 TaxID=1775430 RepID=UPI0007895F7A|nr:hypothetical protein [Flammeovirga sp. SJP92]KXX67702.1 hypothetical protein AVL50_24840 [Flammeovirga sp. SJP92]
MSQEEPYFSVQKDYTVSDLTQDNNGYYYSYSYQYNWVKMEENEDLKYELDSYFFLKLSSFFLEISLPTTHRKFERKMIQSVALKKKKLILPLLVGGIVGPLSLVAANIGSVSLFTGLSLFLGASLLFYFGFVGNFQLEVKFKNGTQNQFFIEVEKTDIQYFIQQINTEIVMGNSKHSRMNL